MSLALQGETEMTLATENPEWGFFGTIRSQGRDSNAAWAIAIETVADFWPSAHRKIALRRARQFLDSSGGRHLADDVGDANDLANTIWTRLPAYRGWLGQ
jgi:hypothetical protein